jgi:3-methylfumaryl-CoA hydratase
MTSDSVSAAEIEHYRSFVGRTAVHDDTVDRRVARLMAATLDVLEPQEHLPPLWHYGLFLTATPTSMLDIDGHPRRGDFLPPVKLARRMFAGSSLTFHRPLVIGTDARRASRIASIEHRQGKSGDLVFVKVASVISQQGTDCIEETQTIVYRPAGGATAAVQPSDRKPLAAGEVSENWRPLPTELFRYSAVTFNTHRIHYDEPYATSDEGYPGLVVHGPLIATRLAAFAETISAGKLKTFTFRGEAPAFVGQDMRLVGLREGSTVKVRTERADGVTGMSATAELA